MNQPTQAAANTLPGAPPPAEAGAVTTGTLTPAVQALFRRSLAQGRMHPLLPLLLRYRRARNAATEP